MTLKGFELILSKNEIIALIKLLGKQSDLDYLRSVNRDEMNLLKGMWEGLVFIQNNYEEI